MKIPAGFSFSTREAQELGIINTLILASDEEIEAITKAAIAIFEASEGVSFTYCIAQAIKAQ